MAFTSKTLRNYAWASILWAPWWSHVLTVVFTAMAVGFVAGYAFLPIYPTDDLLRHVVSYAWGYSHTKMFALSSLPDYNLYPLFDWIGGLITKMSSPIYAVKIISTLCIACTILTAYKVIAFWGNLQNSRKEDILLATLIFLAAMTIERASYGRADAWSLIWGLWASTLNQNQQKKTKLVIFGAVLLSMSYWLALVVFPFILISGLKRKSRILIFSGLTLFHLLFWMIWTHGDIVHWPQMIAKWTANRPITVGESLSMLYSFFDIQTRILLFAFMLGLMSKLTESRVNNVNLIQPSNFSKKESNAAEVIETVGLVVFYAMTNMSRYVPAVASAGLKYVVRGVAFLRIPDPFVLILAVWMYGNLILKIADWNMQHHPHPAFILSPGSRVLTSFDVSTYSMINANPGRIEMIPSMEVGAGTPTINQMVKKMSKGQIHLITCSELRETGVTHVVAWNVSHTGECMKRIERNSDGWDLLGVDVEIENKESSK